MLRSASFEWFEFLPTLFVAVSAGSTYCARLLGQEIDAEASAADERLSSLALDLRILGIDARWDVVVGTGECIVDYAREWAANLIVMSTHGRQGVARLLLGSVAEKVVRGLTSRSCCSDPTFLATQCPPRRTRCADLGSGSCHLRLTKCRGLLVRGHGRDARLYVDHKHGTTRASWQTANPAGTTALVAHSGALRQAIQDVLH